MILVEPRATHAPSALVQKIGGQILCVLQRSDPHCCQFTCGSCVGELDRPREPSFSTGLGALSSQYRRRHLRTSFKSIRRLPNARRTKSFPADTRADGRTVRRAFPDGIRRLGEVCRPRSGRPLSALPRRPDLDPRHHEATRPHGVAVRDDSYRVNGGIGSNEHAAARQRAPRICRRWCSRCAT